jgi:hypothetical protein
MVSKGAAAAVASVAGADALQGENAGALLSASDASKQFGGARALDCAGLHVEAAQAIPIVSADFAGPAKLCRRAVVLDRGRGAAELGGTGLPVENLLAGASARAGRTTRAAFGAARAIDQV